ncbi:hypothetical protein GLOTRDRAFT_117004 [Gloeophyllum trabeum ATCC 11539]|uniref:K Homology domain-containing protein n=1 Tax=Gloeophyllum trabeum (strain ATCC 11539 / FP-39264 / Madison 617) TaxID=670483 RepID=S7Q115_GLOTA|nr:uncharacterized protein GLOTRDRAFT_117004 [Gloeophyllum trabeum ATCC 11539]EPQ53636.1 hypothetical protein GLOTRDRAFT_117004 [Gloeophyllum trabeum ATCC 11539]
MSSKRKWDDPAEGESASKAVKVEDGKSASEAAAAAAAIAAKIAAQYAGASPLGKDPHDADFTHDIDINDVRNRYMLTKGSTQQQIHDETGASVSTKGTWYPDRAKATEKDPPLYLHISASSREVLQKAIDKVNELINTDLGPLVEDKSSRLREKRKWPEEKLPIGLESIRNFNVRAKVVGPSGQFVKYIQAETGTRVQIKGLGSGFVNQETGREEEVPMYIHVTGPDESQVARAKVLTEDLLEVVRAEHAKVAQWLQHQQMELHQAQMQYASYAAAYTGYAPQPGGAPPPPPGASPPPPPPDGSQPPPPPGGAPAGAGQGAVPSANDVDAYAAYWAAYGYDVNSPQFKEWAASQQQQYAQYYAQQGYGTPSQVPGASPPAPNGAAPPPPSDPAPPPPPPA